MASVRASPEGEAIDAAYQAHVQTLFKTLVINIGDQPVSHHTDEQLLDRFKTGLEVARRARELALTVVGGAAALAPASRTQRARVR
jgi:hypothetical protein